MTCKCTERSDRRSTDQETGKRTKRPRGRMRRLEPALKLDAEACALMRERRHREAVGLLATAVLCCDWLPHVWGNFGIALAHAGFKEDSYAAMAAAADILANDDPAALSAVDALTLSVVGEGIATQQPERALAFQRLAAELAPGDARMHGSLAGRLLDLGLVEEALPHAQAAMRLDPDRVDHADILLGVYARLDMFLEAIEIGEQALKRWPDRPSIRANLAATYLDHGQEQRAADLFAEYLQDNPDDAYAHGLAGVAFAKIGWDVDARREQIEARRLGAGDAAVEKLLKEIDDILDDGKDDGEPTKLHDLTKLLVVLTAARKITSI